MYVLFKTGCRIYRNIGGLKKTFFFLLSSNLCTFSTVSLPALTQMETDKAVCLPRLPRVAVCGGTHGNELSGVYLVRELLKMEKKGMEKEEEEEEPLSVLKVLSNPRAMQQCRRYAETDLNRCFTHATLR